MLFITPVKRKYRLVIKPHKVDREGNVVQEPVYAAFEDGVFETNDQQIIDFIKSRVNFGADFFEVSEVPQTHGYQGNKVKIAQMDTGEQIEKNEVNLLRKEIDELKGMIKGLSVSPRNVAGEAIGGSTEESEVKIDKRTKEYKESVK